MAVMMRLIDRGGRRVREICRECGKLHSRQACPVRRKRRGVEDPYAKAVREFTEFADAFRASVARQA
jgi:hypothetical protein